MTVDCTPLADNFATGGCSGWGQLAQHGRLLVPGILIGLLLFMVEKKADSLPPAAAKYAIPVLLLAIPAGFCLLLLVTGTSFDDARQAGWLQGADGAAAAGSGSTAVEPPSQPKTALFYWLGPWQPFFAGKVVWGALPGCIPEW
eukprot:SAG22_NODE_303_length_12721_cov_3.439075_7_plen_144_part_00